MQKTWYYKEGSKAAELRTLLHLPYSLMLLSFVVIGFGIQKPIDYPALILICAAYFIGIQASHFFDQLPSVKGSKYVKLLTEKELLTLGGISIGLALSLGVVFIIGWDALWMIPLMIIQASFVILYPVATLFKGFFHTDFWFSISFGSLPCLIGFYSNNLDFSLVVVPFMVLAFLVSLQEITLSRHVRNARKKGIADKYYMKPELSLKLLCIITYVLAFSVLII